MIRFVIDAILLLALSAAGWVRDPFLGVIFLGMSLSYASQYWRMIHLVGWSEQTPGRRRILMGIVLALIFTSGVFLLADLTPNPAEGASLMHFWQEDFIPIWIGMGLFSALALVCLTHERRKR